MFIAMNRFRVKRGAEEAFEKVWLSRDSYLDRVPGFVEFHLLKGPEAEDHTLYSSHTVWQSKAAFEAWTSWRWPESNTNLSLRNWPQWVRHCSDWLSSWYWIFARTVWSDANRPVHRAITRSFFLVLSFSILARSCEAMILAFKGAEYAAD